MRDDDTFLRDQIRTQRFTLGIPRNFRVSPDGTRVVFLRSASATDPPQSLFQLDARSGVEHELVDGAGLTPGDDDTMPAEERARKQRSRDSSAGITTYSVDDALTVAAFAVSGALYTLDLLAGSLRRVVTGAVFDPRPNPTGTHIAYVCERRLWVHELSTGTDRLVVGEPGDDISWGVAEFVAAEEMDRGRGYWWSPDGQSLLVERTEQSAVRRWHIADPANPAAEVTTVAYPAAGTDNAHVSLALFGLDGSRVDVHSAEWEYLARVHWSTAGAPLLGVQSRDQRELRVFAVDVTDGSLTPVHTETDSDWVELVRGVPAWTSDGRLVHVDVDSGAYRLFVAGVAVSSPALQVRAVLHVGDEVLFSASESDPTQVHIYRTTGGSVERLSTEEGVHGAAGDTTTTVLSSWGLDDSGPCVTVLADGKSQVDIGSAPIRPELPLNLRLLCLGERQLRAALLLPNGHNHEDGPLPVLLDPYGGPHAQRVLRNRHAFHTPQWLADQGFAVLVVDGRGSSGRGPAWERAVAGELAEVTLADQVDALHAAAEQYPQLDLRRVAIRGWSYGGYLAALAVLRRPDVFHAAIAGAPVTDWSLYDTHYTERYLGHPETNKEVYERNSLLRDAPSLRRSLLIMHGLADDNVFVAHALRLSHELLAAGRTHTFLPLSGATHMAPQGEDVAVNLMRMQVDWLHRELEQQRRVDNEQRWARGQ